MFVPIGVRFGIANSSVLLTYLSRYEIDIHVAWLSPYTGACCCVYVKRPTNSYDHMKMAYTGDNKREIIVVHRRV